LLVHGEEDLPTHPIVCHEEAIHEWGLRPTLSDQRYEYFTAPDAVLQHLSKRLPRADRLVVNEHIRGRSEPSAERLGHHFGGPSGVIMPVVDVAPASRHSRLHAVTLKGSETTLSG
jgi:hypothetical protein